MAVVDGAIETLLAVHVRVLHRQVRHERTALGVLLHFRFAARRHRVDVNRRRQVVLIDDIDVDSREGCDRIRALIFGLDGKLVGLLGFVVNYAFYINFTCDVVQSEYLLIRGWRAVGE